MARSALDILSSIYERQRLHQDQIQRIDREACSIGSGLLEIEGCPVGAHPGPDRRQATVVLDVGTRRLKGLTLGSAVRGPHAETRATEVTQAMLDRKGRLLGSDKGHNAHHIPRKGVSIGPTSS